MRPLTRRTLATIVAVALILWGGMGLGESGLALWLAYGALAVGTVLAYYALTGRGLLPGRDPED